MTLSIDKLYAFVAVDEEGEGITAFGGPHGMMPMVAADEARVESLKPIAQLLANQSGKRIVLAEFSIRTDSETFEPDGGPQDPTVQII